MSYLRKREKEFLKYTQNNAEIMTTRRTGRTTAKALEYISKAMLNPFKVITISDHYPSRAADVLCAELALKLVSKLQLEGLIINPRKLTICYKPVSDACRILYGFK